MGREVLKTAGLTVDDAQFISAATAGRLPGLVAGQIDGVALHPEDVYLAKKQKPTLNLLVQLADLMPELHVQRLRRLARLDRARPRAAARYRRRDDRGQSHHVPRQGQGRSDHREGDRTSRRKRSNTPSTCRPRTASGRSTAASIPSAREWTIDNSAENGDIDKDKKPTRRAGRQFRARQGGGRSRRRPGHHRQLQGLRR